MPSIYELLVVVQTTSVAQFILDKSGIGRVEDRGGNGAAIVMMLSMPLMWLLFAGQVIGTIWAMFALSFWQPLAIFLASQIIFGGMLWHAIGIIRKENIEHLVIAFGVPLVFSLRLLCAVTSYFLLKSLWEIS